MWLFLQISNQRGDVIETRFRLAPIQPVQTREAMSFNRQHFFGGKLAAFASQSPKGAVALMPASTASNLRHLCHSQAAAARTVKFGQTDEGHMRDIEIKPHADRVGGDKIIDFA